MTDSQRPKKRIKLGKAFLVEAEPGTFILKRSLLEGRPDPLLPDGWAWEKARKDVPVSLRTGAPGVPEPLRRARPGEKVVVRTFDPKTMQPLELCLADDPLGEGLGDPSWKKFLEIGTIPTEGN
jgi:hypothetical protein